METDNFEEKHERLGCIPCEEPIYQAPGLMKPNKVQVNGKARFKCDVCEKTFIRTSNLSFHKRVHDGERPYECEICHKKFYSHFNLSRHERVHTGERPHKCNICEKSFVLSGNLANHQKVHADEKIQKDKGSENMSPSGLPQQSKTICDGKTLYKCELCSKSFPRAHLMSHIEKFHKYKKLCKSKVGENGFYTASEPLVVQRSDSDEKPNECTICGKKFKYASGLSRHKKFHSGETLEAKQDNKKTHRCKICDKVFSYSSGLSRHNRIHRPRSLPFKCKVCKKSFTQASYLSQHLSHQKSHDTEGLHKSDFCSRRLKHVFSSTHCERGHPGNKLCRTKPGDKVTCLFNPLHRADQGKHQTDVTNQDFNDPSNLYGHCEKVHIRDGDDLNNQLSSLSQAPSILAGIRPYECRTCKKSFTEQSVLDVHQKSCAGAKSYRCKRCNVCFNQLCDFLSHQRSHTA